MRKDVPVVEVVSGAALEELNKDGERTSGRMEPAVSSLPLSRSLVEPETPAGPRSRAQGAARFRPLICLS